MKNKLALLIGCMAVSCAAQSTLSLQEAISIGLKNNYAILLAKNDSMLLANDATPGAAGMLPSITANFSNGGASNSLHQKFATGLEVDRNNVGSGNMGANLALNWTLFDGFKMFVTLHKLREISAQGEWQVRRQMENSVVEIITAYYNIARQKQQITAISELISVYEERVKIANARLELGNGNKTDLLQAKVDLNEQKSGLINLHTLLANGKVALNILLSRDPGTEFDIRDSIALDEQKSRDILLQSVESQNTSIHLAKSDIRIADLAVKENEALRYPKVGLGLTYNFSRSTSQAGLTLLNQSVGPNYGLTLSWNVFNGGAVSRSIQDARYLTLGAQLRYQMVKQQQEEKLFQAYKRLEQALNLVRLEQESVNLGQENVTIMLERFKLGQSTTLELKEAQRSLLNAKTRLVNARFDAKVAETEVKQASGSLLQ